MDGKLKVDIHIEDTPILHFSSFTLEQRFNTHHYFELRFNHDEQGAPGMISLEKSRSFMGKSLSIQFGKDGKEQQFTGKVTKVELSQSHGYHGTLIVSGYSPSILIDRGPDLGSYLNKDLSAIIRKATEEAPANDLNLQLNPARKSPIDYIIQYRESDFEFLNRLSAEYHEWFYYDGTKLHFGKPDKQEEVPLMYGRDVHSLQYSMQLAPLKASKFAYNPKDDQTYKSEAKAAPSGQPDLAHAVSASNELFGKVFNGPVYVRVDNKQEIDAFVQNEEKASIADLLQVTGTGDNPAVALGKIVDIGMSVREALSFKTEQLGKFLVTSIYHNLDGVGHYYNTFEGIVADTERIPIKEYDKPLPDMQLATVIENDDPKNQGRVKVQFKWECANNDGTEWLRVVSPNAGSGDKGNNRGFMMVPEKGDQVVVAFEEGNIARPVVMGAVYHGKSADSSGFKNSGTKAFNSRMGSTLTFNDDTGSALLADAKENSVTMDGVGNITINASKSITLVCGGVTIELKAEGETITANGKAITMNGADKVDLKTKEASIDGSDSFKASSKKVVEISSGNTTELKGNSKTTVSATGQTCIEGAVVKLN